MTIHSFRHPVTNDLQAWGYSTANTSGDIVQVEADGFNLEPGKWRWNGTSWMAISQSELDAAIITNSRNSGKSKLSFSGSEYTLIRGLLMSLLDEINVLRAAVPRGITSITRTGGTGTVTTRDPHGLVTGATVKVQGATLASYNVLATSVTVTSGSIFTYPVSGNPTSPATGTLSYTLGNVPSLNPLTTTQIRTSILAKIDTGTVDI